MQKRAVAGSLESNDIFILITGPTPGAASIELESIVKKQFGEAIFATISASLKEHGLTGVSVAANDKGALDCTIRARMETAITRYQGVQS